MKEYLFFFDLDATITSVEMIPYIAKKIGKASEVSVYMEQAVLEKIPYNHRLMNLIDIIRSETVSSVRDIVKNIPLNEELVRFLCENKERCYIVTSNLDVWVESLMERLDMKGRCYSSKASIREGYIQSVDCIVDKCAIVEKFVDNAIVSVGDGNNDAQMMMASDVSIGYGGVRDVSSTVLKCATHLVYSEERLCQFLRQLL